MDIMCKKLELRILSWFVSIFFITYGAAASILPLSVPNPMSTWVDSSYQGEVIHPITGEAPVSWQAAQNMGLPTYYIDSTHASATDKDNPNGSPGQPRLTISETTYPEGSYVEIHGGPYSGGGQIIFKANGTPGKPVWFRGGNSTNKAIITGEIIAKGQYLFIENLKFENRKSLSLRTHDNSSLSNVVIRNLTFTGDGIGYGSGSAIPIYSNSSANRFHDILLYNNEISFLGNDYDDSETSLGESQENDYHGIHPDINVDRVWIFNNKIHNLGGDSVQVSRASTSDNNRPSDVFIINNEFYSNLENAVDVKTANNTLIMGNVVYDWRQHRGNTSTGAAIVVHNKAKNTWIVNNYISDAVDAVIVSDGSVETWVIGNVIHNIKHSIWDENWASSSIYSTGSAIHFRGGSKGGAINNTIINTDKGFEGEGSNLIFINNIIVERNESSAYDLYIGTSNAGNKITNNLIYHSKFNYKFKNTMCLVCIYDPPKFINGSFEISLLSPAIGSGTMINFILNKYTAIFSTTLDNDIKGGVRVIGGIDIGAYENQNLTGERTGRPNPPEILGISIK